MANLNTHPADTKDLSPKQPGYQNNFHLMNVYPRSQVRFSDSMLTIKKMPLKKNFLKRNYSLQCCNFETN